MADVKVKKKICLLGSYSVGKTSLVRRFVHNKFEDKYLSTIGVHISKKKVELKNPENGNTEIEFLIWDIANIEKFDLVVKNYLRGATAAIVVADVTRPSTREHIEEYIKNFNEINIKSCLVYVVNKIDLVDPEDFDKDEFVAKLNTNGSKTYFTSAKTGENVEEIFSHLAFEIINN